MDYERQKETEEMDLRMQFSQQQRSACQECSASVQPDLISRRMAPDENAAL
jgi:hypothetical protein